MNSADDIASEGLRPGAPHRQKTPSYAYDPRTKSPLVAGFLSCMPGLGQVYVGYYQRGFIHILVVASVIATIVNESLPALLPLLGLFLAFFWLYNIIDAARRASMYNLALQGADPMALPDDFEMPSTRGSVAGGVTLIVMGFIFLLHTRFGISLDWMKDWWPMAPLLFGVWLVYKGMMNGPAKRA